MPWISWKVKPAPARSPVLFVPLLSASLYFVPLRVANGKLTVLVLAQVG